MIIEGVVAWGVLEDYVLIVGFCWLHSVVPLWFGSAAGAKKRMRGAHVRSKKSCDTHLTRKICVGSEAPSFVDRRHKLLGRISPDKSAIKRKDFLVLAQIISQSFVSFYPL